MTLTTLRLSKSNQLVSYRDSGAGDPIVLLHGVGMQSAAWLPQINDLERQYRVVALDLPGHGGSDPLKEGSPLEAFVEWCHAVTSALGLVQINLVGHSMGALIASGFAVTYPQRTQRTALLNGVFCRSAAARSAVVTRADEIAEGHIDIETPLARWFGQTATDQYARADVARWLRTVNQQGYATAYGAFARGDTTYAERFPQIAGPFLALTADGDPNSTPAMSQDMAESVQDGRWVVVKNHRHMVNLTAPNEVNAHLQAWLKLPLTIEAMQ